MLGQHIELAAAAASKSSFNPTSLILILVVIVGVYMLMIRPQRRRQQQAQQQKNTVVPGARVRTTAGMYATVVDVDGDDVVLEVAPGVEVRYMRRAIMDVVSPGDEPPTDFHEASEDESDESDEAEETGESADADHEETDSDEDETYRTATGSTTKND